MGTGDNSGSWGSVTNTNLTALEEAIARTTDVTFADDAPTAAVTLSNTNDIQAGRNYRLNLIGTGTAGHVLLLPTVEKSYLINNTLSVDVSVRNGTAAGTNLFNTQTVPAGGAAIVYTDGSAVTSAVSSASAMDIATTLDVGGAASVGGTLRAGAISGASISSLGAASVGTTLTVTGAMSGASISSLGAASVGTTLTVTGAMSGASVSSLGNASVGGTFTLTGAGSGASTFNIKGNTSVGGTFTLTGAGSGASTFDVKGNTSVGGTFTVTDNISGAGTLAIKGNASVGGTLLGTGGVSDADGSLRDIPRSRTVDTSTVSAAATDAGNYIFLTSSDQTVVIPSTANAVFAIGDIFSVVNAKATADSTTNISSNMTNMFVAGGASATATVAIAANGVASVLFVSAGHAFVTGNVE